MNEKGKLRKQPTAGELRDASKHVCYEIDMLIATASKLIGKGTTDETEHRAYVESFLSHSRQLHHFLYRDEPQRENDVVAAHYSHAWSTVRPSASQTLGDLSKDVGRRAAHLTTHRVVGQAYPIQEVAVEIVKAFRAFLNVAQPDLFAAKPEQDLQPAWAQPQAFMIGKQYVTQTSCPPDLKDVLISVVDLKDWSK